MRLRSRFCIDMERLSHLLLASTMLLAVTGSASAQDRPVADPLRVGLEGALRGCEIWVLDPSSWLDDPARFLAAIDLGGAVFETESLPEPLLPPEPFRRGNRYWRINAGPSEGYALVVSRDIPMCHITGGGGVDFRPAAEAVVASPDFVERWEPIGEERRKGMVSTSFRLRKEPKLALVLSRADAPGARRDRAQVIGTATYDLGR
ncbi:MULTISPECIES: hypothetical protein [unclassified Aureimonas]|uniref:hypothetical protein n=1 Tax=unclassified Aureimonas TaxID=2615206 RepID=UPI0006FA58D7|nr:MULTISPECIES: hypothetical protein [unclassified Aureimonas]KQT73193.1 hypothetical protein ASG54_18060 [Aureimonas sp. Leaf460]